MTEVERKQVRLRGVGGSRAVILPKEWLRDLGVEECVELIRTPDHIVVAPLHAPTASIEDEPEFAQFLDFLARTALADPGRLGNVVDLLAEDADLVEGVEPDA